MGGIPLQGAGVISLRIFRGFPLGRLRVRRAYWSCNLADLHSGAGCSTIILRGDFS